MQTVATADARYIVAIDPQGNRQQWKQTDLTGTADQANAYLDSVREEVERTTDFRAQAEIGKPRQLETVLAVFTMLSHEGFDHPRAAALISSVGTAAHLILETTANDTVIIDLQKMMIGVQSAGSA